MSNSPAPKSEVKSKPAPRPSRFRKRTRRLLIALAMLFVGSIITLFGARAYFRTTGERDLKAEIARLDAEDPGWKWDDLQATREKASPPEAENSAKVVREVRALTPKEWKIWVSRPKELLEPSVEPEPPPNRLQPLEDLARDQELLDATREARNAGLKLRNYPRGYHAVVVNNLPFVESLDETQGAREVINLMKVDAILAAQDGDPVRGLQGARAILNAGRSIGDEPSLISSLVRFAIGNLSVETAMRVLALTDSKESLPELALLQAAILAEVDEPILLNGFRGERAVMNRFFTGLNDGTIGAEQLARMGGMKLNTPHRTEVYFRRAFWPEDQRRYLQLMSEFIAAAKKPYSEQIATVERIERDHRANRDIRYLQHGLVLPLAKKVMEVNIRHRAELVSAAALIACERFRLARGRWPESLAEIPKDLLPAIPTDPFTGEPMKFARLPDGITVYSLPPKDAFGKKLLTNPLGGNELGWRLYDPPHRGLPLLPRPKPDKADMPDEP